MASRNLVISSQPTNIVSALTVGQKYTVSVSRNPSSSYQDGPVHFFEVSGSSAPNKAEVTGHEIGFGQALEITRESGKTIWAWTKRKTDTETRLTITEA